MRAQALPGCLALVVALSGPAFAQDAPAPDYWQQLRESGSALIRNLRERARPRQASDTVDRRRAPSTAPAAEGPAPVEATIDQWIAPDVLAPAFTRIVVEPRGKATIEGKGTPGSRVQLKSSGRVVGTATVERSGRWKAALDRALTPGVHRIDSTVQAGRRDEGVVGADVRIAIPEGWSGELNVSYNGAGDMQHRDPLRDQAEAMARDASEDFSQILREQPAGRTRVTDKAAPPDADRSRMDPDGETENPVIRWLERSAREYQDTVVKELSEPSRTASPARGDREPADTAEPDRSRPTTTVDRSRSARERLNDWLARSKRGYQDEVARKLAVPRPGEPGEDIAETDSETIRDDLEGRRQPEDAGRPQDGGRDERTRPDSAEERRPRLAEERERVDEARRRQEAENARLQAEADERRREQARRDAEAKRAAEEQARIAQARRDEEEAARRKTEAARRDEEKRRAAEQESQRQEAAKREAEANKKAELAKREAEAKRLQADLARKQSDKRRLKDEAAAKDAEAKRLDEVAKSMARQRLQDPAAREAEAKRQADEMKKAEARRLAEEAERKAAEREALAEQARKEAREREADREEARRMAGAERQAEEEALQNADAERLAADVERRTEDDSDLTPSLKSKDDERPAKSSRSRVRDPRPVEGSAEGDDEVETHSEAEDETEKKAGKTCRPQRARRHKGMRNRMYVVQPGDTLWGLARRYYGDGKLFHIIYRANRGRIRDPNIIIDCSSIYLPRRKR